MNPKTEWRLRNEDKPWTEQERQDILQALTEALTGQKQFILLISDEAGTGVHEIRGSSDQFYAACTHKMVEELAQDHLVFRLWLNFIDGLTDSPDRSPNAPTTAPTLSKEILQ